MDSMDARYPSLENRVVFVTGGGSGIGESIVEHFCDQNAQVTFIDIQAEPSRALVERVRTRGQRPPRFIEGDLKDIDMLQAAVARTGREDGPIRVLVNNAANDDRHRTEDVSVAYWDDRMAVNLRHQFFAAQAVRPQMRDAGGGSIINLGSVSWMIGEGDCIAYVTAKSAVNGLTRGLARELGPEHIRVNSVVPGWVMTKRQLELWVTPEGERLIDQSQCLP
jgi:NAD(P)-dependent dehydrogenase (short-subunit alcohol dehydrogenase family)